MFLARGNEPLLTYRGTRHLEAHNDKRSVSGWMEVATEMTPAGFRYRILREGGSDMIRGRVFRAMLENEEQLFAAGDAERSSFTPSNYDVFSAAPVESGLLKVTVRPKRREIALIDGAVYITDTDADLVRVEGRLAKNPSFWTKRVDIVKQYRRVGGRPVPVRIDSTAQMRFAGTAVLTVTFDYEMVDGVSVAPSSSTVAALAQ